MTLQCVTHLCGTFVTRRPHFPSPPRVWTLFWWSLCSLPSTQHGNKGHTHIHHLNTLTQHAPDIRVSLFDMCPRLQQSFPLYPAGVSLTQIYLLLPNI